MSSVKNWDEFIAQNVDKKSQNIVYTKIKQKNKES